ncbi:hypothetical protein ACJJTC_018136 [Scirpophaga incertulas]
MDDKQDASNLASDDKIELSRLIKRRGIIKGRLTKYSDYLNIFSKLPSSEINSTKYRELELKANKVQDLLTVYDELQNSIDILHWDSDEQIKERDEIESQFFSVLSIGQELLNAFQKIKSDAIKDDQCSVGIGSPGYCIGSTQHILARELEAHVSHVVKYGDLGHVFSSVELAELNLKVTQGFEVYSNKFEEIQCEIEVLNDNNLDSELDEREDIEQEIIFQTATAKQFLEKTTENANQSQCSHVIKN